MSRYLGCAWTPRAASARLRSDRRACCCDALDLYLSMKKYRSSRTGMGVPNRCLSGAGGGKDGQRQRKLIPLL